MEAASMFRCPSCGNNGLASSGRAMVCEQCSALYGRPGGFFDFIAGAGQNEPTAATSEQRLMESELVARLYERVWRPTFVRMFAGSGAGKQAGGFQGEFFIHRHALGVDERPGPWLDLSCGPGNFTRALASAAPSAYVVGLDISRAMLEVANKRSSGYSNVTLVRADAHDIPLADGSMAGVNNSSALHAYDDPETVFSEVRRVLAPDGVYVGSAFAEQTSAFHRVAARVGGIRRFDSLELRSWLSRIGFVDYDEIRLGGAFIFRTRRA